jgi:hypothetical protein
MVYKLKSSKTEAEPVSETLCRFYLEAFTLCASVFLCWHFGPFVCCE